MNNQNAQVTIVTGGGSGIGLAIAKKFADAGIQTIIVGRDENKLRSAQEEAGTNCFSMPCDLSDLASIPVLIEKITTEFGRIDILVNNAGINMKKDFTEVTDAEFQQIITTNLCSV